MNFLDQSSGTTTNNQNVKQKISSTIELAQKLGILTDKELNGNIQKSNKEIETNNKSELLILDNTKEDKTKIDIPIKDSKNSIDAKIINNENKKVDIKNISSSQNLSKDSLELLKFVESIDDEEQIQENSTKNYPKKNSANKEELQILDEPINTQMKTTSKPTNNKMQKEEETMVELGINTNDTISLNKEQDDDLNDFKVSIKDLEAYFANAKEINTLDIDEKNSKEETTNSIKENIIEPKDIIGKKKIGGVLSFQSFEFKGKAKEYFKIWIVNIALTILTLGIYSAWAKVRNLRYIYGNTYLNNSNFEFNADPKRILYGRAIVFTFYAIFIYASNVLSNPNLAGFIVLAFILILPWLVKQAIRFKLKSASYRNINFKYHGKARSFYFLSIGAILAFIAIFSPLFLAKYFHLSKDMATLAYGILLFLFGIIGIPLFYKKFKEIIINNSSYGNSMFTFKATKRSAISTFLRIGFSTAVAGFVFGILVVFPVKYFNITLGGLEATKNLTVLVSGALGSILYLSFIGLYKGITDGYLSNFIRNNTKLDNAEFKSSIMPYKLGIISMTNILATVLSLGLLYPWAKMRYLKYKIENTQFACRDYDKFLSTNSKNVSTLGEEAVDFFDIDIGV